MIRSRYRIAGYSENGEREQLINMGPL
jgi:hypothetical protein